MRQSRSETIDGIINSCLVFFKVKGFEMDEENGIRLRQTVSTIIDNEGKEIKEILGLGPRKK